MYFSLVAGCTENSFSIHTYNAKKVWITVYHFWECTAASLLYLDKQLQDPSNKHDGEDEPSEGQSEVLKYIIDVCQATVGEAINLMEFYIDHS